MIMEELREDRFDDIWNHQDPLYLFIHTPFCGTCQLAERMLRTIEEKVDQFQVYKMNASLFPDFMETYQITSVPCLMVIQSGEIKEVLYAFHSVPYLVQTLVPYLSSSACKSDR